MMKKITLIEPKPPGYHVFSMFSMPRLGLPILGALLKSKGYSVKIYFEDIKDIDYSEVYDSDLVGISTITSPRAYAIADKVRKAGIPLVLGGVHPTFLPEEALEHADYVVRGEGEETMLELMERIEAGEPLDGVLGLSYNRDGEHHHNPDRPRICDLDLLPFPDFSLLEGVDKLKIIPISASRGCPFDCNFCSVTAMFGRRYRFRSVDSLIEEISRYKNNRLFFCDDNFTANLGHTKELLERMLRKNLTPRWSAQVRVEVARDRELLELMKRARCTALFIGFESINPKTLEAYNKKQDVADIKECIKIIHRYGIKIHGMFVLGSDEDDVQTIRDTGKFANKMGIDTIQFSILTPLPGSKLYNQLDREERILTKEWDLYDGLHAVYEPQQLTPYQLQLETFKAMKKFYSLPQFAKLLLQRDFHDALLRAFGGRLIKKWERANADFMCTLKSITEMLKLPQIASSAAEFLERSILVSWGAMFLTEKRARESVSQLIEEEKIDKAEGQKLLQKLLTRIRENREALQKQMDAAINKIKPKELSKQEISDLKTYFQQLSRKLAI